MIHLSLLWVCVDCSEHEGARLPLSSSKFATRTNITLRDTIATDHFLTSTSSSREAGTVWIDHVCHYRVTMIKASLPLFFFFSFSLFSRFFYFNETFLWSLAAVSSILLEIWNSTRFVKITVPRWNRLSKIRLFLLAIRRDTQINWYKRFISIY